MGKLTNFASTGEARPSGSPWLAVVKVSVFTMPDYCANYRGCSTDTADLILREGRWWLHVGVTVPAPEMALTEQVVGVEVGLSRPAVTSHNRFLGKRACKAIEGRLFKLKRALQKRGAKSAQRHLRRVRHRQARFRRDCDHVLSKQIIRSIEPGGTLVLENLKGIRSRTKVQRKSERLCPTFSIALRLPSFGRIYAKAQLNCIIDYRTKLSCRPPLPGILRPHD